MLAEKLRPDRITGMSPFMAAIVGYVLGEPWAASAIAETTVSGAEDPVSGCKAGGTGFEGDQRNTWNRRLDYDCRGAPHGIRAAKIMTLPEMIN